MIKGRGCAARRNDTLSSATPVCHHPRAPGGSGGGHGPPAPAVRRGGRGKDQCAAAGRRRSSRDACVVGLVRRARDAASARAAARYREERCELPAGARAFGADQPLRIGHRGAAGHAPHAHGDRGRALADESTLDLIKFVGRCIDSVPAMLAVSFRDDEVSASHPLRRVIALAAAPDARVESPLSPKAWGGLAAAPFDLRGLHALTRATPSSLRSCCARAATAFRSVEDSCFPSREASRKRRNRAPRLHRPGRLSAGSWTSPRPPCGPERASPRLAAGQGTSLPPRAGARRGGRSARCRKRRACTQRARGIGAPRRRRLDARAHRAPRRAARWCGAQYAPVAARGGERCAHREAAALSHRARVRADARGRPAGLLESYAVEASPPTVRQAIEARERSAGYRRARQDPARGGELQPARDAAVLARGTPGGRGEPACDQARSRCRSACSSRAPIAPAQLRMLNRDIPEARSGARRRSRSRGSRRPACSPPPRHAGTALLHRPREAVHLHA